MDKHELTTIEETVLDDFLNCSSQCEDIGNYKSCSNMTGLQKIEKMVEILPGIEYIRSQMLSYLFSNGLTTGSINEDIILDNWMFKRNSKGATNYDTLREAIGYAAVEGECGLRWVNGDIYIYRSGHYGVLTRWVDGIEETVGFYVHKKGQIVHEDINLSDISSAEAFLSRFEERGYILLATEDFDNLRNDTSSLHGDSPLLKDKLRMDLLMSIYGRLNYDIEYDGPGRIILRPKKGFGSDDNDTSSTNVLNNSIAAQRKNNEEAMKEVKRIASQIKESSSDSVIVISSAFADQIEHLERVTKATEFFDWLDNEGVILAQAMGMSPSLLELGHISGNVSMEKIIDNSMLNNIVPLREKYAIQFSAFIAAKLGVTKVYFDKYELQQAEDENETRKKISEIMVNLARVNHFVGNNDQMDLINDLAQVIKNSLYDENNELRAMSVINDKSVTKKRELKIKRGELPCLTNNFTKQM